MTAPATRSPTRSASIHSPPRCAATVSPEPRNSRLLTVVTCTPADASVWKTVGCGCHCTGSTSLSQNSAFSSRSEPGTREVKPTTPCAPGVRPVPREVRLVAVVDGTPAVAMDSGPSSEERYGAAWACDARRSAPRPSTRKTTYAGAEGRSSVACVGCGSRSERQGDGREHVGQRARPVGRLEEVAAQLWVRADSESAKDSSEGTASGPSAAAETRIEKSSAARVPV